MKKLMIVHAVLFSPLCSESLYAKKEYIEKESPKKNLNYYQQQASKRGEKKSPSGLLLDIAKTSAAGAAMGTGCMLAGPFLHAGAHNHSVRQYERFLGEHWESTHPAKDLKGREYVYSLGQRREDKEAFVHSEMMKHFYNIGVLGANPDIS
jgi:hypothetical protein